jgi:poly-gamma-glutamate capsule biosynthesis protein CapA/YwtB (metallophosphatase superfamily)
VRALRGLVVVCLLALPAGCGSPRPVFVPPSLAPPSQSAPPTPVAAAATSLTLAFGGDVHFTGRTLPLLDDPQTAFGPFAEQLRAADFAMVNLETAVTGRGTPQPKRYHFRAPTSTYAAVQAAGIDVVSIANNHTLDYGQVGLIDTLESAVEAKMPVVGAGRNVVEAYKPYLTTVKGVRIGVVALSQVHELAGQWKPTETRPGIAMAFDLSLSVAAVKQARGLADLVVVYLHWGTEGSSCPNGEQKSAAQALVEAGAQVIVGTHAHVPQGDGFIGSAYVHYGLGNFLWYGPSKSTDTGLLTVTVSNAGGWKVTNRVFTPGVISDTGQAKPVTGSALASMEQRLSRATACTGLPRNPS